MNKKPRAMKQASSDARRRSMGKADGRRGEIAFIRARRSWGTEGLALAIIDTHAKAHASDRVAEICSRRCPVARQYHGRCGHRPMIRPSTVAIRSGRVRAHGEENDHPTKSGRSRSTPTMNAPAVTKAMAARKKVYRSIDELQVDLDLWVREYKRRDHVKALAIMDKTPMQTFLMQSR